MTRTTSGCLVVAAALALAGLPGRASAQDPGTTIRGEVRDTDNRPLAGAEVLSQRGNRRTTTDAAGRFTLDSLPTGEYRLVVRLVGYRAARPEIRVPRRDSRPLIVRLERAPQLLPEIVVESEQPGVRGVVGDSALRPIAGATVALLRSHDSVVTDLQGRFAFTGLKDGAYMLAVTHPMFGARLISVLVERGQGLEYSILLAPRTRNDWAQIRPLQLAMRDLDRRLAFEFARNRMTRQELERYRGLVLCNVPRFRTEIPGFPTPYIVVDGHRRLSLGFDTCLWSTDEVELLEWGRDPCTETTGTVATQLGLICTVRGRRPRVGWMVIWERK